MIFKKIKIDLLDIMIIVAITGILFSSFYESSYEYINSYITSNNY